MTSKRPLKANPKSLLAAALVMGALSFLVLRPNEKNDEEQKQNPTGEGQQIPKETIDDPQLAARLVADQVAQTTNPGSESDRKALQDRAEKRFAQVTERLVSLGTDGPGPADLEQFAQDLGLTWNKDESVSAASGVTEKWTLSDPESGLISLRATVATSESGEKQVHLLWSDFPATFFTLEQSIQSLESALSTHQGWEDFTTTANAKTWSHPSGFTLHVVRVPAGLHSYRELDDAIVQTGIQVNAGH